MQTAPTLDGVIDLSREGHRGTRVAFACLARAGEAPWEMEDGVTDLARCKAQ